MPATCAFGGTPGKTRKRAGFGDRIFRRALDGTDARFKALADGVRQAVIPDHLDRKSRMADRHLGKDPMTSCHRFGRNTLPSGGGDKPDATQQTRGGLIIEKCNKRFRMTEKGFEEIETIHTSSALESDLYRYYPDGIETIRPQDVVASGKAETYDVLPQEAGLLQLMKSGALSLLRDGAYSIDKPIARFPAGLTGAHSVKFVLRRGVPVPAGSPGHSPVLMEETGNASARGVELGKDGGCEGVGLSPLRPQSALGLARVFGFVEALRYWVSRTERDDR